mgnify:CR=1 FL=1
MFSNRSTPGVVVTASTIFPRVSESTASPMSSEPGFEREKQRTDDQHQTDHETTQRIKNLIVEQNRKTNAETCERQPIKRAYPP